MNPIGSPHGMLILAPKGIQASQVVANRKNRRFAAKIKRDLITEARISARRKKDRDDARSKD